MTGSYHAWLVALSVLTAALAAYATLGVAGRVAVAPGRSWVAWLVGGAVSMGTGIWSMHFIGMLAFQLPIAVTYDLGITLASMVPAVIASGAVLYVIRRRPVPTMRDLVTTSVVLGVGIGTMHYSGMAALHVTPGVTYSPFMFGLSLVVAVGLSAVGVWLAFRFGGPTGSWLTKLPAAVVIGLAVSAMHYVGMEAAHFDAHTAASHGAEAVPVPWLAFAVSLGTLFILGFTVIVTVFDARLAEHNSMVVLARAALAESEVRFARMATNVPGVIFQFFLCEQGEVWYSYLSEGCRTVLGVDPEHFPWKGAELLRRIHPDDFPGLREAVRTSHDLMEPWSWEGRVTLQSGSTHWLRAASRPTRDATGRLTWDGLLMDITEEKTAVEALHRREEQLADAQEIAHIGSWEWDLASGAVAVSDEHWRIFGFEPGAFPWSYQHYMDAVHPDDRELVRLDLERSVVSGTPSSVDYRIVRPDGMVRYVSSRGRVVLGANGTPVRMIGTAQDLTERRQSEERFRNLFDHVADAFFLHGLDGRLQAVNPAACDALGYSEAELLGRPFSDFLRRRSHEELVALWQTATPGNPVTLEATHIRRDGSTFPAEIRTGLFEVAGSTPLIIATVRDISAQKQAAAALEKRVQVEQALTRVSRLLAAPSAEIDEVLRLLAEAVEADRAYLFRSRSEESGTMMDSTHEWRREGVPPAMPNLQGIDVSAAPWWIRKLRTQPSLVIQDLAGMPPEAAFERSLLEQHGVHATAAVPITDARNGLLGFLGFDYVTPGRRWSEDDVQVLETAGEMLVSHFARQLAEREILQRDGILEAANFMAERFLRAADWESGIDPALAIVGAAAGVSRAYLFQTYPGENGEILVGQRAEWVAEGIQPMLPLREFSRASLPALGLARWDELFRRNLPVRGVVSTLPEYEAGCLAAQGIRSILQIPIYVGDRWWGTLGFDDCVAERKWSVAEAEVLATTGRMIAAAVQRTMAEEALRESEERFRQMAESMSEVFFMVSAASREVIYLSPAYETVWGRSRSDTHGFIDSILPDDRQILFADMALSESGEGDPLRFIEYRIVRPDGSIRWIQHRTFQVRDAEGRPYRVTGVCSDITEQKQMEEELRRTNRIEAIGHLAAGIAHEINTPIQYIGDNVRFLDETFSSVRKVIDTCRRLIDDAAQGPLPAQQIAGAAATMEDADIDYVLEEAPRATSQALDGVQRVAEIVRAMKEFSHPGSGQKVPTDLNQAIRSTTTIARSEWKYVAELVIDLDEELPPVPCLPGELNQAVLNLVVNAAHAIADRQQGAGSDVPGTIVVATRNAGEFAEIRVSDTGTGIPAEIGPRIFDPFFTTKEVGRGTGQGLTFVHSIVVDKHQGTVTFETEAGVGTTFILRIPQGAKRPALGEAA